TFSVVFVHGLTGNRTRTWSHDGLLWPKDLLPKTLPNARIMTFGYDADVLNMWSTAGQNRIGHHGSSLARSLADFRDRTDMSNTPIIFVAHSLGGLVCESAILECKNSAESQLHKIVENTRGIVFMGTPHAGADLANWATLFTNFTNLLRPTNHRIVEVLTPDSEVLAGIQKDFHTMLRARRDTHKPDINIMCFFEELPVAGVGLVVPHRSAILPSYGSQSIHANHMDMPKFSSEQDPGYLAVSTMLWRWQKDLVMYARS
ncbi:Alpha/Beta hydrolase protein, partial [Cadophora sp. MPI-SDFR-AT-0126]